MKIKLIVPAILAALAVPVLMASTASAHAGRHHYHVVVSGAPYAGHTDWNELTPNGVEGQQNFKYLDREERLNALKTVQAAQSMNLPTYAAVIAIATALQESGLHNYTESVDHDSLGTFQQRPSMGWGTVSEIEDPAYAAKAFLRGLEQVDYQSMSVTDAAQSVQRSADPYAYAQWTAEAAHVVQQISNGVNYVS